MLGYTQNDRKIPSKYLSRKKGIIPKAALPHSDHFSYLIIQFSETPLKSTSNQELMKQNKSQASFSSPH